ncbi:MAG: hypothetical protein AAGE59_33040 [Cyanobacteria bacterium P01_F01_bin.86]
MKCYVVEDVCQRLRVAAGLDGVFGDGGWGNAIALGSVRSPVITNRVGNGVKAGEMSG